MIRIAMAGGPGCGKSSLSRQLTTELYNKRKVNCQYVTEMARDYINKALLLGKFVPSIADQLIIFSKQIEREQIVPQSADFLITDSPIFLPLIFFHNLCDFTDFQQRTAFLHIYESYLDKYLKWYDYIFVLKRQKPFLKDGTRHESEEQSDEIGNQVYSFLKFHKIPFHTIQTPNDEERVKQVLEVIGVK